MFPPMPQQGQTGPASPQNPDPSTLVAGLGATPPQGPSPEQIVQEFMRQIQSLHAQIDALASQHPEASKELQAAKQALTDSMTPVAANMTQGQSTQPQVI